MGDYNIPLNVALACRPAGLALCSRPHCGIQKRWPFFFKNILSKYSFIYVVCVCVCVCVYVCARAHGAACV